MDRRSWIDEDRFLNALNFCMLLPGPEAQQLAAYIGWRLHGIKGGLAAGAFFVIPSIFFLLLLSYVYAQYGSVGSVAAVLNGFKPIVVAIVVEAVLKIGKRTLKSATHVVVAVAAFLAIQFFNVPFPIIVGSALILGLALNWSTRIRKPERLTPEEGGPRSLRFLKVTSVCVTLWSVPFLATIGVFGWYDISVELYLFFTQAAFVTFGGAYAVLAYVNQAAVGAGWITSAQAVEGLALAETTPGPLIMVLQFIGFMTGWHNHGAADRTLFAVICALLATFATFLPSFFFVFSGAPYVERLQESKLVSSALVFVTAAVVGVILNLSILFGSAVLMAEGGLNIFGSLLAAAAFTALYFFKLDVLIVVIAGGLAGLAKYSLFD